MVYGRNLVKVVEILTLRFIAFYCLISLSKFRMIYINS